VHAGNSSLRHHGAQEVPLAIERRRGARVVSRSTPAHLDVHLLDGFALVSDGERVALPLSAQRLIAFLALHDQPLQRVYVAGKLWLQSTDERAFANLRSAIWRTNQSVRRLVFATTSQLCLFDDVTVDLRQAVARASRLVDGSADEDELSGGASPLTGELLPDWYDDWVLIERERHRQLVLHALDALAARLTRLGRFGEAVEVALAAIAGEPLRESAHRYLIETHLAEGNPSEALRHFEIYRQLLRDHLDLEPSSRMDELVRRAHAELTTR
jgi:DNA-binding SARP family transcriptional activator